LFTLFVSCSIKRLGDSVDLSTIPEFVQLTNSPISQAFLSAISLRMEENSAGGFQKIMALIDELIHDNRKQLQFIRRMNERVNGRCLISNNRLENRVNNFASLTSYFKSRGALALTERGESQTAMGSRNAQATYYTQTLTRLTNAATKFAKKWTTKISDLNDAYNKVNAAIKAVNDWTPKSTFFVEKSIKEGVEAYVQAKKGVPLKYDTDMIQLGANDVKIRRRLYQWLNMVKAGVVDGLDKVKSIQTEETKRWTAFASDVRALVAALQGDAKLLKANIASLDQLIKNYNDNEKIYASLQIQSNLVLTANKKYCNTENVNYDSSRRGMQAQLKVFAELRQWLRKNYHKVRSWVRKQYAKVQ